MWRTKVINKISRQPYSKWHW